MSEGRNSNHNGQGQTVSVRFLAGLGVAAIGVVLLLHFFDTFSLVLLGFLMTASVCAMLKPLGRYIPWPRGATAVIVGMLFLLAVAGLLATTFWLLVEPIQSQLQQWPQLKQHLDNSIVAIFNYLGLPNPPTVDLIVGQLVGFLVQGGGLDLITQTADTLTLAVIVVVFIFMGSIYLLAEPRGRLLQPLLYMLPPRHRDPLQHTVMDLEPRLRWWLIGTMFGMLLIGLGSYVGYLIIGLQFALPMALLAGLLEAVPTIGPAITFVVAFLIAATQGAGQMIGVAIVYAAVQTLEGNVVLPLVMKKAVKIPPIISLFSIILWGKLLGIAGLLLAIPIDLVIWSVLDNFIVKPNRQTPSRGERS